MVARLRSRACPNFPLRAICWPLLSLWCSWLSSVHAGYEIALKSSCASSLLVASRGVSVLALGTSHLSDVVGLFTIGSGTAEPTSPRMRVTSACTCSSSQSGCSTRTLVSVLAASARVSSERVCAVVCGSSETLSPKGMFGRSSTTTRENPRAVEPQHAGDRRRPVPGLHAAGDHRPAFAGGDLGGGHGRRVAEPERLRGVAGGHGCRCGHERLCHAHHGVLRER